MRAPTREQAQLKLDNLKELVQELYIVHPCGGPLHIITDDGNVKDGDITWCYRNLHNKDDSSVFVKSICKAILHELALMSEAQRVVWWLRSAIEEEGTDPIDLYVKAYDAHIVKGNDGKYYDDKLVIYEIVNGQNTQRIIWEGLDTVRTRRLNSS